MEKEKATTEQTADLIIGLYEKYGDEDYIGEPVSQVEHMCQCATLAEEAGCSDDIILAAFFHDIGHLCEHIMPVTQMDGYGVVDHEKLGADFLLSHGFTGSIASLVRNHVQAKRYLTFSDQAYYDRLSTASKKTLEFQGGRMTAEEAASFRADPLFEMHIRLRQWDEKAKLEEKQLPPLSKYRKMIVDHLSKKSGAVV
ncbi:MAG: phosphohydrolase [Citrobacter freundii]|nr:MAG: phosphohydrolase [Citrobacter freundii]